MSPFASSIRQQVVPTQGFLSSGIGSLKNLLERRTRDVPQENVYGNMVGSLSQGTPDPMPMDLSRPAQLRPARPLYHAQVGAETARRPRPGYSEDFPGAEAADRHR